MSKWIREDGWVMSENIIVDNKTGSIEKRDGSKPASYQISLPDDCYINPSAIKLIKDMEMYKRKGYTAAQSYEAAMSEQLSWDEALEEFEKMWQENYEQEALLGEQLEEENESGESSTTKSGTNEEARQPRNNSERVAKGKPCEFSECTCGHKGVSIPLSSHSDWCDYKLWRESLNKRAEEYSSGRIFF